MCFRAWAAIVGNNSPLDIVGFGRAAGNQIIEELKINHHHKQLPPDAADKALARLARLDGQTTVSVAQVSDALRKTMQTHCGVFRFPDMLKQGVAKMTDCAERARQTAFRQSLFNTARAEALAFDNLVEVAMATMVSAEARTESRERACT